MMTLSASFSASPRRRVDGDLLALDRHGRRGLAPPKPPRMTETKLRFMRLAHDVAEDGTRGADQRADHDQQVVAEVKPIAAAAQPE
jgi:hypothetical protein